MCNILEDDVLRDARKQQRHQSSGKRETQERRGGGRREGERRGRKSKVEKNGGREGEIDAPSPSLAILSPSFLVDGIN